MPGRVRVKHYATANDRHRGVGTNNKTVSTRRDKFCFCPKLHESAFSGRKFGFGIEYSDTSQHFHRADMQPDSRPVFQQFFDIGKQAQRGIEYGGRGNGMGRCDLRAALQIGIRLHARNIDGDPRPGFRFRHFLPMHLQAAHTGAKALRHDFNGIPGPNCTGSQRSGDNRAKAGAREYAIDGQAEGKRGVAGFGAADGSHQRLFQGFDPFAGCGGNANNRSLRQKGVFQMFANILLDNVRPFFF